jgi:hypothetical protein
VGTILGPGVVVGAGATPPAYSRFSTAVADEMSDDEDDDDEDEDDDDRPVGASCAGAAVTAATAAALAEEGELLGAGGVGVLWKVVPTPSSIGGGTVAVAAVDPESDEDSEEEEEEIVGEEYAQEEEDLNFAAEVNDTVKRAVGDNHSVDNVALEVNALKFAQNRTFSDCVLAILPALLEVSLQPRRLEPATL